jgi:predicted nucleic acid-binding protein
MNRPEFVVDASVAVKWILPEEGQAQALRLQEMYQDEELDLVAPYLLISEVGNVLWKRVRRGELTSLAAHRCYEQLLCDCPILLDSPAVQASSLHLALAHNCTVYDCLYLAWALEERCDLITADEKFFKSVRSAFPCVRLLSAFDGRGQG